MANVSDILSYRNEFMQYYYDMMGVKINGNTITFGDVDLYYPDNIVIIEKGLSDECGEATFYESDCSSFSSITGRNADGKPIPVELATIDSLVESGEIERIDFIKADIEGAERNMLRGAVNILKTQAPKLSICTYHYPDDKEVLEKIIKDANPKYKVIHRYRKLYAWVEG